MHKRIFLVEDDKAIGRLMRGNLQFEGFDVEWSETGNHIEERVKQFSPLTMGWCLDCHRDPEPHRRPLAAVASMTWSRAEDGAPPPAIAHVRPGRAIDSLTTCTTCHR